MVRIACFSDPHSDIQKARGYPHFLTSLRKFLEGLDINVILVTGDIAGSTAECQKFFDEISFENIHQLFVPGNHDIWVNSQSEDGSWIKYYQILPELCKEHGWGFLPKHPIIIDEVGFTGSIGWYDYSTRNENWDAKFSIEDYMGKTNPDDGRVWMDRDFVRFGHSDTLVAEHFNAELLEDISWLLGRQLTGYRKIPGISESSHINLNTHSIRKLVVGTHIVPFKSMVQHMHNTNWDYFSAFIGNKSLGEMLTQVSNLIDVVSISGHTHYPQHLILSGIQALCVPFGYPHEWSRGYSSLEEMFNQRIKILDL